MSEGEARPPRVFLFLQGLVSPFFARLADALEARGHRALRVNLCFGDRLFWRRPGAVNYRGTREAWPEFVAAMMDREGVTDLVLLGEQRFYHRAAIDAARERDITVAVAELGYLRPDWITLELDGMSGESRFPRDADAIRALAARVAAPDLTRRYEDSFRTMVAWDVLYHLSSSFLWMTHPHYRSHQIYHPVPVYLGTGLRLLLGGMRGRRADRVVAALQQAGVPTYLFPLQKQTDFQIRAYSPFGDLETALGHVVASFARAAPAEARLLLKVHPHDPGIVSWARIARRLADAEGVRERVVYLDGGRLDRMLAGARGVVTINSTAGLQALIADKPVIALGEAVFDVAGLTFQGPLDRFWIEAPPPDRALRDAFVRALAGTVQVRGVFYRQPGLDAAVAGAAERLDRGLVNQPLAGPVAAPDEPRRAGARD